MEKKDRENRQNATAQDKEGSGTLVFSKLQKKCKLRSICGKGFAVVHFLMKPSGFFVPEQSYLVTKIFLMLVVFLLTGFSLNSEWVFPNFTFYAIVFSLIFVIAFVALLYFYRNMDTLHGEVTGLSPFDKAEYFYIEKTEVSPFYIIFPLCFIMAFGIGGSIIYGAISFTPTFIWCLLYFALVVYFSMLAYSQFVRFAAYLHMAAHNTLQFENLIMSDQKENPPKLSWLIRIARISQILNFMFFAVGALYILAFGAFCFSPIYDVKIGAGLFYILWTIIFVFIVLAYPIICCQKAVDIRRLVAKTKDCYIREILLEDRLQQSAADGFGRWSTIMRNYCISIVLGSPNYPTNGKLSTVYSAVGFIINFVASIATILEYQGIKLFHT